MRRFLTLLSLLCAALVLSCSSVKPLPSNHEIGVVLMHGKTGTADFRAPIGPLVSRLRSAGILVVAPDMPWSRSRYLAKGYTASMAEIDAAVAKLRERGATRIVVAGHSMGGNAALGYGARRDGLAGIIVIAPGHVPDSAVFQNEVEHDWRRARAMVDEGKGDETAAFADTNQGHSSQVRTTARVYLSWFDPQGPAVMPKNAAALRPGTALLWVVGDQDSMSRPPYGRAYAFDKAPANPKSAYLEVPGGHLRTPRVAADRIVGWLESL